MKRLLLVLVACNSTKELPPKPNLAGMGPDGKCLATEARGTQCADELMIYEARSLGVDGLGEALTDELRKQDAATPREALKMHRVRCMAGTDYADALARCWDVAECEAFARCVYPSPPKTGHLLP